MINPLLQQQYSALSSPLVVTKIDRKFLVLCAFWLTLLLGSSWQLVSSYLPDHNDRQAYQKAFIGRRFFSEGAVARQVRAEDFVHEGRHAEPETVVGAALPAVHADAYKGKLALYCDRTHYRTDVCVATGGDVRVVGGSPHGGSYRVFVSAEQGQEEIESVKPYTRKWETSVMENIDEVMVIKKVLRNGSTGSQASALPWISSAQQNVEIRGAPFDQSATLHGISNPISMRKLAQRQEQGRSSTQRRRRRPINDSFDNSTKEVQKLRSKAGRSKVRQGSHDQIRVQKKKAAAATGDALQQGAEEPFNDSLPECEVRHEVPAILFSTGGYTGNVYHEFNDGLIPLFITAQKYAAGQVVLIILEYHWWWMSKYAEVLTQISNYTIIDLAREKRVHCFPEVTVGLRIHDELAIHAENPDQATMEGFQSMLRTAYAPKVEKVRQQPRPRLVLLSRSSPRALLNEREVIAMAKEVGFSVQVLAPTPWMRMADIYNVVRGCDVMVGVHGAAMTHLLFMRPGATFIQVVPLGTDWAAATYYGEPAQKLGLNYVAYRVQGPESSLWQKYARDDPVLVNPESVNKKGWWETKRIYLEAQDVTVSLTRMRVTLLSVYARAALTPSSSLASQPR